MSVVDRIKAAVTGDDATRLAGRREINRQRAQRRLDEAEVEEINAEIRKVDADVDAAMDAHQKTCLPKQTEIERLESRILEATVNREPIPDKDENRRRKLLQEIEHENQMLSD